MSILKGKVGLIMGVANNRSIGWGIAKSAIDNGAQLIFTYQNDLFKERITQLVKDLSSDVYMCDVEKEENVIALFDEIEKKFGKLDFIVHSLAFSDKDELRGRYVDTSLKNFLHTMHISCYSLVSVARHGERLLEKAGGGSLLTLTYYGAEKVMPHYNVMGVAKSALETSVQYLAEDLGKKNIRVNAISAGPIKTLAASGIGDFRYILKWNEYNSPLRRGVTIEEVGDSASFLLSDMSRGITGEVLHVDAGYHVVGMKAIDAPDLTLKSEE